MVEHRSLDDYWHAYVYVNLGWFCCAECRLEPDLEWAWRGLGAGEDSVQIFTTRAVEHLKKTGWLMHADEPHCPACANKLGIAANADAN
jgi:hypothetical protein